MGPITNFLGMNPNGPALPQGPIGGLPPGLGLPQGIPGQGMSTTGSTMAGANPIMLGGGMAPPSGQAAPMGAPGGMAPDMASIFQRMAQAGQAGQGQTPQLGGLLGGQFSGFGQQGGQNPLQQAGGFSNLLADMTGGRNQGLAQAVLAAKGGAPAATPAAPAAPQWAQPQWQTAGAVPAPTGR